jgi:NAD(P)-dependent dehydrogenase (short-subunit alcohol dehydrogenase family)
LRLGELLQSYGELVRTVALDVTDAHAARAAEQLALDEFGGLDVVVNNAGYANSSAIEETTDEDFRAQIEANLFGVLNVTNAALPGPTQPRRLPTAACNGRFSGCRSRSAEKQIGRVHLSLASPSACPAHPPAWRRLTH